MMRPFSLLLLLTSFGASAAEYYNPSWSHDGKRVAFESSRDGRMAIYVVNADGSGLRRLTEVDVTNGSPTWSPDDRRIAFASARDGRLQLYVMQADGSGQRRIVDSPTIDYAPDWSSSGQWIAFISRKERPSVMHDLCVIRPDGSGRRCQATATNEIGPAWSSDGRWIFFEQNRPPKSEYAAMTPAELKTMNTSSEIARMSFDGRSLTLLTGNGVPDCCVHAGRKSLYFTSGETPRVHVMDLRGRNVRPLDPAIAEGVVSPDEKRFVYTRNGGDDAAGLWIYDRASAREHRIVSNESR